MSAAAGLNESEADFQRAVIDLAQLLGWRAMHVRRSRVRDDQHATATSIAGWPDVFFFHPKRHQHFAVEFKSQRGRLSSDQRATLADLADAGVEVHVWRPSDWVDAEDRLRGGGR